MRALDRAITALRSAHDRNPLAAMPDRVTSPMDQHRTITISRELIRACDPRPSAGLAPS